MLGAASMRSAGGASGRPVMEPSSSRDDIEAMVTRAFVRAVAPFWGGHDTRWRRPYDPRPIRMNQAADQRSPDVVDDARRRRRGVATWWGRTPLYLRILIGLALGAAAGLAMRELAALPAGQTLEN